jgi:hypothetical protein
MNNTVFKYNKKRGMFGAIDYLTGDKTRSVAPTYLRGNEAVTRELLANTTGTRAYTAGVCSFKEMESQLDSDLKNEVMDLYEETLLAGFPPEHYCMDWIEHTDKNGRLELNWHIVNQDLVTGRVLQPYFHKQDQVRIDLAKQIINDKYNLHSPDDPANFRDSGNRNNFGDRARIQERIIQQISAGIESEQIDNRQDIIELLNATEWIDVSRVTKNSISIKIKKNDEIKKPIRFAGGVFSDKFDTGSSQYAQAKIDSAREFSEQRERRLVANTKRLKELNENIAGKRQHLLTAPIKKVRNTNQNKQTAKATFKPNEPRATSVNHVDELKKQRDTEIHAPDNIGASVGVNSTDSGDLDRDASARLKTKLLNKITAQNDKYNQNIDRGRTGDTSAISDQQQRTTRIIEAFIDRLQKLFRGVGGAIGNRIKTTHSTGRCVEIRTTTAPEIRDTYAELNEKCHRLNELIVRRGRGGITIKPQMGVFKNAHAPQQQQECAPTVVNTPEPTTAPVFSRPKL